MAAIAKTSGKCARKKRALTKRAPGSDDETLSESRPWAAPTSFETISQSPGRLWLQEGERRPQKSNVTASSSVRPYKR